MTCQHCAFASVKLNYGGYHMACLECCTRLVLSSHPMRHLAQGMLELVRRHHGPAGRAAVSECVRQRLGKLP